MSDLQPFEKNRPSHAEAVVPLHGKPTCKMACGWRNGPCKLTPIEKNDFTAAQRRFAQKKPRNALHTSRNAADKPSNVAHSAAAGSTENLHETGFVRQPQQRQPGT